MLRSLLLMVVFGMGAVSVANLTTGNSDGCSVSGVLTVSGWTNLRCDQLTQCTTNCEIIPYGPIISPVYICKCKGAADPSGCLAILNMGGDGNMTILGVSCLQLRECELGDPEQCIDVTASKDFMPSYGNAYPVCQCLEPNF